MTVCPECGASAPGVQPACPNCGWPQPEHLVDLREGEVIFACGRCGGICRLGPDDNPALTRYEFAHELEGATSYIPLTVGNTVFRCAGCQKWNWVTLDDRITRFEFACPECGAHSRISGLGRHLRIGHAFLRPIVLGEWRTAHKHLELKCGHAIYLPRLLVENKPVTVAEPPAAAAPSRHGLSPARGPDPRKKTQPLPFEPSKD